MFSYTSFFKIKVFFIAVLLLNLLINHLLAESNYIKNSSKKVATQKESNTSNKHDTLDKIVDLVLFSQTLEQYQVPVLKAHNQLQLSLGVSGFLMPHTLTSHTLSDTINLYLEFNPFYQVKVLDMLNIRFEIIKNRSSYNIDYYQDSLNYCSKKIAPPYNGTSIDIIYHFIKKDFLTLYTGYAIHSRYDVMFIYNNLWEYQENSANNFFVGSNIRIFPYTFIVLEYRLMSMDLMDFVYNASYWGIGINFKIPII